MGTLTSADDRIFVPVIDKHRVVALAAATGKPVWDFTAGGRVDTPPTLFRGLALFGSADGWAYCLRCSDGQLVWKRRAAPQQRLVGVMGQLESAWPVHGSVLVDNGIAYVAAGRSSYLDGGIHLTALRPETGEVLEHRVLHSADPETGEMPAGDAKKIPGMLADILVSDGSAVWMRQDPVFGERGASRGPVSATGGFRDDTWFNRTSWSVGDAEHAQLLVFDERVAYGVEAYATRNRSATFKVGEQGYRLFATALKSSRSGPTSEPKTKNSSRKTRRRKGAGETDLWSKRVPIRGTAMALAGDTLFVAGTPDVLDPADSLAPFEGRQGGLLWAVSSETGERLAEYKLESPPIFDGLIAAGQRILISTLDGRVVCMKPRTIHK